MNYRLKKEAVEFFREELATQIHPMDTWNSLNVDLNALEEVKPCYISYGIKTSETSASLSGWANGEGGRYHFTVVFPSIKYYEHDKFSKGRNMRELMDKIQCAIDEWFSEYN